MKTEGLLIGTSIVGGKGEGRVVKLKGFSSSGEEISRIFDKALEDLKNEDNIIAQYVRMFLTDPVFRERVEKLLSLDIDPRTSVKLAVKPLVDRLSKESAVFRRRAEEIEGMLTDLVSYPMFETLKEGKHVFVGETITVPIAIKIKRMNFKACVVKHLSRDSHAAIILSNAKIPTISNIDVEQIKYGDYIYVNGDLGVVSYQPIESEETLITHRGDRFYTGGGEEVEILLNIDFPEDIYWVDMFNTGVGLFRTEYMLMVGEDLGRLKEFSDIKKRFVIRAFDMGADKSADDRSPLRLLSDLKQYFDKILEIVKSHENFHIMIPMISFEEEAMEFYKYVVEEWGISRLGFMVETPMSVRYLDKIQKWVSFLSVGTNDLWSLYTGKPRGTVNIKEQINEYFGEILREIVVRSYRPLSVCGALASDEEGLRFLLKLGFRRFSVSPSFFNKAVEIVKGFP